MQTVSCGYFFSNKLFPLQYGKLIAILPLVSQKETPIWCVNDCGSYVKLGMELSTEIQTEIFYADHMLHLFVTKSSNKTKVLKDALAKCSLLATHVAQKA